MASQGLAPGALVFSCDMHLNIPVAADVLSIVENQQAQTDLRLEHENCKQTLHDCSTGKMVCVNDHHSSLDKLKPALVGPFLVEQ